MQQAIDAIVVGSFDLGEADRVIRLLTPGEGRISVVARRARSSRRRFGGMLEVGTHVQVVRSRSRGRMMNISEVDRVTGPDVARTELERIALLSYGCEVCAALAPEAAPAEKLFQLLVVWLDLLEGPDRPTVASRVALEAKALTFAGLTPALGRCAACSEPVEDPMVFDVEMGGALHARCGGGQPTPARALLELEALRRMPLADTVQRRERPVTPWRLSDFVQHQLGRRLQSRSFLETIGG